MENKLSKDYSISFARCVAMIFIVTCHILQYFNVELAWWFNVGVQMFLFISGFLYGKKTIDNPLKFYKKTFSKILVDYYIYIIIFTLGYCTVNKQLPDYGTLFGIFTFSGTINGLRHLWFIPYILFCYLITPLFNKIFNAIDKNSSTKACFLYIASIVATYIIIMQFFTYFKPAYIVCFILGMIMKRVEKDKICKILFLIIIFLVAIALNSIQIYLEYYKGINISSELEYCAHVLLGASLVIVIRYLYLGIKKITPLRTILDLSDRYSYSVYITHHLYILSPISLYAHYQGVLLPTMLVVILTSASAVLLNKISTRMQRKLIKNQN